MDTLVEYIWNISKIDESELMEYIQLCDVPRPLAITLLNRGIRPSQLDGFFQASLSTMTDPYRMPDMGKAVRRMWEAIQNKEKVIIHGDYDTDGVTSATLIHWVLESYGANAEVFISNRMEDGYGPTPSTMAKAKAMGASLVISSDCGITAFDAVDYANENGIDVIITDHHNAAKRLPAAMAIVNPRVRHELVDLHGLAGVGVAFKLCHAFVKYALKHGVKERPIDIREALDLVAMGTVADVSPLIGENRSLVRNGLKLINLRHRPGLRALAEVAHLEGKISPSDISRRLAPKINAAGRVGNPMVSVELLQTNDYARAVELAQTLERYNKRRRQAERKALKEAFQKVAHERAVSSTAALVIVGEDWHPGVIGLIATKISKEYNLPTIVLSNDSKSDELIGSGRSNPKDDILEVLVNCDSILSSYGGHPMAVGVSMVKASLPEFKQRFLNHFDTFHSEGHFENNRKLFADGHVTISEFDQAFFDKYELFEPFGSAHSEPVYYLDNIYAGDIAEFGESNCHGLLHDRNGDEISFVIYTRNKSHLPPQPWEIMASPRIISVAGQLTHQLLIHDLRSQ